MATRKEVSMNFISDFGGSNSTFHVSCGDSRSSCGSDTNVKRDHATKEKTNNS